MSLRSRYRPFTLTRQTPGAGAMTEPSYLAVGNGVFLGFVQPVSASESSGRFAKVAESYTHRLYTDVLTPVQYGDRVRQNGVTYRAIFVTQAEGISGVGHHKEVLLQNV